MEDKILDERFQDFVPQGLKDGNDYIRDTHHRERTFWQKNTTENVHMENHSRHNHDNIKGCEITMSTRYLSIMQCHDRHGYSRPFQEALPHEQEVAQQAREKKFWSCHNSISHNDDKYYSQMKKSNNESANYARVALRACMNISHGRVRKNKKYIVVAFTAWSQPSRDHDKDNSLVLFPAIWISLEETSKTKDSTANLAIANIIMPVDAGASGHYLDDHVVPELRHCMLDDEGGGGDSARDQHGRGTPSTTA